MPPHRCNCAERSTGAGLRTVDEKPGIQRNPGQSPRRRRGVPREPCQTRGTLPVLETQAVSTSDAEAAPRIRGVCSRVKARGAADQSASWSARFALGAWCLGGRTRFLPAGCAPTCWRCSRRLLGAHLVPVATPTWPPRPGQPWLAALAGPRGACCGAADCARPPLPPGCQPRLVYYGRRRPRFTTTIRRVRSLLCLRLLPAPRRP